MNFPKLPVWTASGRLLVAFLGLLVPAPGWSEPLAPTLPEQLAAARTDEDDAAVVELCRRELESSPGDVGLLQTMFRAQLELKDCTRAAETITRLETASAPPAMRAEMRGDLAKAGGKPADEALAAWREALAARPPDAPALLGKIADTLDSAHRWPEAAEACRAYLRARPGHAARTASLALCLLNAGHADEADKEALAAVRLDAADETVAATTPIFERLRPQLPALRKLAGQIAAYKTGAGAAPGPDPRLDRALILYRARAYNAALEDARRSHEDAAGRSLAACLLQGQCLWKLQRDEEAEKVRVAKIDDPAWFDDPRRCDRLRAPDDLTGREDAAAVVRVHAARAMVLLDGNQPVLALEDAEKAVRAEEKAGRPTADTQVVLTAVLLRNDRPADALAAARRATGIDPRNADAWALCGRLAQETADFPAAVDSLSRALGLREEVPWLRRRETCLRVLGRNAEADRDALRAAKKSASS